MPDRRPPESHDLKALVRARIGAVPVDPVREADIVDELAQHVAEHYADLLASGCAGARRRRAGAGAARRSRPRRRGDRSRRSPARIAGRLTRHEPAPPPSGGSIAGTIARDVRYAMRLLLRAPGFAAAAIITLALGIGANAAIFSVVRAVVLKPPPYRDPSRVVAFLNSRTGAPGSITSSSLPDYEDWQRQLTSFDGLGLLSGWTFNITGLELPERVFGARVSGSLFPLLGTPPLLGRVIEPADDRAGRRRSPRARLSRLAAAVRGATGTSSAARHDGRTPAHRHRRDAAAVSLPDRRHRDVGRDQRQHDRHAAQQPVHGRGGAVETGVSSRRRRPKWTRSARSSRSAYPETNKGWRVRLAGVHDAVVGDTKPALLVLVGAVGLVLLIACANVSNLLLARATSRRRETAIRLALGAGRGRLVAQWLTENLVLSLAGGAGGVALAYGAVRTRRRVRARRRAAPRRDGRGRCGARVHPRRRDAGRRASRARAGGSHAAHLVACGDEGRDRRLLRRRGGPRRRGVDRGRGGGRDDARRRRRAAVQELRAADGGGARLRSRARAQPQGVPDAASLPHRRLRQAVHRSSLERWPRFPASSRSRPCRSCRSATPRRRSCSTSRAGRSIPPTGRSRHIGPSAPTISGRCASRSCGGVRSPRTTARTARSSSSSTTRRRGGSGRTRIRSGNASGGPLASSRSTSRWHTIVGVVADVKSNGLDKPEPPAIYAPYPQRMFTWLRWNSFVVRTHGEPQSYARAIREELTKIDPMQPIYQVASLDTVIAKSVAARRFHTGLVDLFAALGARAVRGRRLRHHRLLGRRAHARNRRAHGARRHPPRHHADGGRPRGRLDGDRRRDRHRPVARRPAARCRRCCSACSRSTSPRSRPCRCIVLGTGAAAAYIPARRASPLDPLSVIRGE